MSLRLFQVVIVLRTIIYGAIFEQHFDDSVYFDSNTQEYETFLTPTDFLPHSTNQNGKPSEADLWDSDAMYNADKFEGDIANHYVSNIF